MFRAAHGGLPATPPHTPLILQGEKTFTYADLIKAILLQQNNATQDEQLGGVQANTCNNVTAS